MENRYNPYYQQQGQYPQQQGQQAASMSGNQPSGGQVGSNKVTGPTGVSTGDGGVFYGGGSGAPSQQNGGTYKQPYEPTPINYNAYSDLHGFGSPLPASN